jgi:hypothetical protein
MTKSQKFIRKWHQLLYKSISTFCKGKGSQDEIFFDGVAGAAQEILQSLVELVRG